MDVRLHQDQDRFKAIAEPFYGTDPIRHTLALTVMARFLRPGSGIEPRMMTMHGDDGDLLGVALRTPPWPVIASGIPTDPAHVDTFVAHWLAADPEPPGVTGPRDTAEAFARAWARHTNDAVTEAMAGRLFRLGDLVKPDTNGFARHATEGDIDLLARWRDDFQVEATGHVRSSDDGSPGAVRRMLEMGDGTILWEHGGEPVSWAVVSVPIDGMSRVGPVYTPPAHRAKGYGSAVTAAVSQYALDAGAAAVVLFTNLANPTSNSIYQKIGYRPVYDSTELEFTRLPSTT